MVSLNQIKSKLSDLISEIQKGVESANTSYVTLHDKDALPSILTYVPVPDYSAINKKLQNKTEKVYVLNCGGTNWECTKIIIENGKIIVSDTISRMEFVNPQDRIFEDIGAFVRKIAELLMNTVDVKSEEISVAFIFGFIQINKPTKLGIDIQPGDNKLNKGWYIGGDIKDQWIGEILNEYLYSNYNIKFKSFVAGNDAAMMMWDHSVKKKKDESLAPIGGVWGSGTNMGSFKNGKVVNLEIGYSKSSLLDDDLSDYKKMKKLGCILPAEPQLEVFIGGDYIFDRFALEMFKHKEQLSDELFKFILEKIKVKGSGALVGELAEFSKSSTLGKLSLKNSQNNYELARNTATEILMNTANRIALMIASVVLQSDISKDKKWVIPAEGTVIRKGYKVIDQVQIAFKELIPQHKIRLATDGSSKKALALFTSYINSQR